MNSILVSLVLSVSKLVASFSSLSLSLCWSFEGATTAAGKTDEAAVSIPVYPTSIDPVKEY